MKRVRSVLLIVFAIFFGLMGSTNTFAEGEVVDKPVLVDGKYQISTVDQLLYLSHNFGNEELPQDGHYVLMNDLDMTGVDN